MNKKDQHRIQIKNRTPLQNVIPLQTPFVVYMDPSSACNFKCKFCPTGEKDEIAKTTRWNGIMDWEIYKKAVNDLSEFDAPIKALKLYKDGEPLLNKNFAKMVEYAKKSGCVNSIETTTNGSLLTPEKIDSLIAAGLDRINISVYGMSAVDFTQFSRAKVNFEKFIENIRYLYEHRGRCHVHIKTTLGISSDDTQKKFFKIFESCSNSIDIENLSPFWPGYEFDKKYDLKISENFGTFGQRLEKKLVCPYLFYALAVNSDGRVDLCSCDWTHDYILGDLRNQSLKEIWNSQKLYNERVLQLRGLRMTHRLCKDCNEISYESVDNVDDYRDELLNKLLRARNRQTSAICDNGYRGINA